jgi:hypothetical protein
MDIQSKDLKGHIQIPHGHLHKHECKHSQVQHREEKAENWQDNSMFVKRRARNPPELLKGKGQHEGLALCPAQSFLYYLVGEEEYQNGSNRREKSLDTRHETIYRIHCILKYSSIGKARKGKQRQARNNG